MATRPKLTDPFTWARTAASKDACRPVLTGLEVATNGDGYTLTATDGHRLHSVAMRGGAAAVGVYAPSGAPIDGSFPNWKQVIPAVSDTDETSVLDVEAARPVIVAAAAGLKASGGADFATFAVSLSAPVTKRAPRPFSGEHVTHTGPRVYVNPAYLLAMVDGMRGGYSPLTVTVRVTSALAPIVVTCDTGYDVRTALVMPVRVPDGAATPTRFGLDMFTEAPATAAANAATVAAATRAADTCAA